jgi:hypothetical protein
MNVSAGRIEPDRQVEAVEGGAGLGHLDRKVEGIAGATVCCAGSSATLMPAADGEATRRKTSANNQRPGSRTDAIHVTHGPTIHVSSATGDLGPAFCARNKGPEAMCFRPQHAALLYCTTTNVTPRRRSGW